MSCHSLPVSTNQSGYSSLTSFINKTCCSLDFFLILMFAMYIILPLRYCRGRVKPMVVFLLLTLILQHYTRISQSSFSVLLVVFKVTSQTLVSSANNFSSVATVSVRQNDLASLTMTSAPMVIAYQ